MEGSGAAKDHPTLSMPGKKKMEKVHKGKDIYIRQGLPKKRNDKSEA
jgi:hypothetical protein